MNNLISKLAKSFKGGAVFWLTATLIVSGFFAPNSALAAATVTPASGGTNISIDTTSAGGSDIFTEISGPGITERAAGDIVAGTHTVTLPAGWIFDTASTITVFKIGNIGLASTNITPGETSFKFTVTSVSTNTSILGFNGIKIKPTGAEPSTGNMTYSGDGITGVTPGEEGTNFGTLSTIPGMVTKLVFATQLDNTVYGSLLNPQPVVKTQDQFGNDSTNGLASNLEVGLSLATSSTGALVGDTTLDIGTSAGNGTVTFADLTVDEFGDKQLTAAATGGLTSAVSNNFEITKKPLTAMVAVDNKDYDGNDLATITGITLDGVVIWDGTSDNVTTTGGTATFASVNADTHAISVTGVTLNDVDKDNYTLANEDIIGIGTIYPLEITITPTAGQTKIYGQANPVFTYTFAPDLISPDTFTGVLGRIAGEDANTYAYTLGTLENGLNNYALTLSGTFEITQKALTVTATGVNKEYDQTTNATVTLSSADEVSEDNLIYSYTGASFLTKTAENGKTVNVSGISIDGAKAGNYDLQNTEATTNANITKKPVSVTIHVNNKTYNSDTNAVYASENPRVANGVIGGDTVVVENTGSKAFIDKHVGVGKTVNATGLTLSGADAKNYDFNGTGMGVATISARAITVTAVANSRTYNGTTGLAGMPEITSGVLQGADAANFIQTYDNKNVGTGKTLTPSGTIDDGNGGNNYLVTLVPANVGVITAKTINVTAQSDTKIYDRTNSSDEIPEVDDLEVGDVVATPPTQSYNTENVDTGKTLTASGLVIDDGFSGANYDINYINNTTGAIEAKELTVIGATTDSKTYDGGVNATVNFASAALNGVIPGEGFLVSLNSTDYSATFNNKNIDTGKEVTVSGLALADAGASNYSLTQPTLNDGVITKRLLTVTAVTNTKPYDGLTTAIATPTITDGALASGDAGTFTEAYDNANVSATHILTPAGTIADAGSFDMTGNYDIAFIPIATGVIDKASLIITVDNKSKVYGNANPPLTASYVGFVNGENESVLGTTVKLNTSANETTPVGNYEIIASGATAANYIITFNPGTLTITPAPMTITADAKTKVYGDDDPEEFTYQVVGLLNGDELTGSLSREEGENVGEYAITSTLTNDNYDIEFISADFTIEKRPLIVTAVIDTKIYDGTTDSGGIPLFVVEELQFDDKASFTQSYDTPDFGNNKILTATGIVNDGNGGNNYSYNFTNTAIGEIIPLEITIIPTIGLTKVYGEDDPTFTFTPNPALIDGEFSGALSRGEGENVGTYAYALGTLSAGGNYILALTSTPSTFAITKATPVITWENPADIVYGTALNGTQLNATADVAGAFVYTPVSGIVLNAGAAQTLSVVFTPTDATNYNDAEAKVLIDVNQAPLAVTANDQNKIYGTTLTFLGTEFTTSELVDGDTVTSVTLISDGSSATAIVADYDIVPSVAVGSGLSNYDITYNNGTLTVEDTVAPTVVSHTPSFNALNISPTTPITITFSEAVIVEDADVSFSPAISGGFTISGTNVITITPNNPLEDNTTYAITLDGVADINGLSLPTYNNIKFTTATNYSIGLNANASGWNLISLPVIPSNTAITAVLGDAANNIDAVWTYDPTNPNAATTNGWLVYVPGNSETNNLDIMTAGFGYWVSVTGDANLSGSGTLLIAGPTPPPSRSLQTGWNLIGYYQLPNENDSIPTSAFASIGAPGVGYNGLWGFDNTTGFFNSVTMINPGNAFWISLPSAKTYTPSNIE